MKRFWRNGVMTVKQDGNMIWVWEGTQKQSFTGNKYKTWQGYGKIAMVIFNEQNNLVSVYKTGENGVNVLGGGDNPKNKWRVDFYTLKAKEAK